MGLEGSRGKMKKLHEKKNRRKTTSQLFGGNSEKPTRMLRRGSHSRKITKREQFRKRIDEKYGLKLVKPTDTERRREIRTAWGKLGKNGGPKMPLERLKRLEKRKTGRDSRKCE